MRKELLSGSIVVAAFVVWLGWSSATRRVYGQPKNQPIESSADLIVVKLTESPTGDRIAVVDPRTRAIAVYHIGRERGESRLESVRAIRWDLQMSSFNSESPSPEEIRLGLDRK